MTAPGRFHSSLIVTFTADFTIDFVWGGSRHGETGPAFKTNPNCVTSIHSVLMSKMFYFVRERKGWRKIFKDAD